jgi:hypothetical protein
MPATRPTRVGRALATLLVVAGSGCVSVLGLGSGSYEDANEAAEALCARICTECASGEIPFGALWTQTGSACDQASCVALVEDDLVMSGLPLPPFAPCFSATGCSSVLGCLANARLQLGSSTSGCGAALGQACFDECPRSPCEPWQCASPLACTAGKCAGTQTSPCE